MTGRTTSVLVGLLLAGTVGYVAIGDEKPDLSSGRIRGYPWRDMIGLCLAAERGIPGALAACTDRNASAICHGDTNIGRIVCDDGKTYPLVQDNSHGYVYPKSEIQWIGDDQTPVPACAKFPITRRIDGKSMDGARADGSLDYDSIRKFCAKAADCFIGPRLCDDGKTYPLVQDNSHGYVYPKSEIQWIGDDQTPVPACAKFPITRRIDGKSMDGARADGSLDYNSIRKFCAKAADCFIGPRLCDDGKTYPLVDPRIASTDRAEVCGFVDRLSYSRRHRALLTEEDRKEDFARAGVLWSQHRSYELDHTLSLSLGGADVPANRHPQPCSKWDGYRCVAGEAAVKDRLELLLWQKVCKENTMPLAEAQSLLLGDWRAAYRQQFGVDP